MVTAPGSGAEIIPFLKTWVNLPMAIGFTILYAKVSFICLWVRKLTTAGVLLRVIIAFMDIIVASAALWTGSSSLSTLQAAAVFGPVQVPWASCCSSSGKLHQLDIDSLCIRVPAPLTLVSVPSSRCRRAWCTVDHWLTTSCLSCLQLANVLSTEALFYTCIIPFIIFFGAFAFVIYPLRDTLHPTGE